MFSSTLVDQLFFDIFWTVMDPNLSPLKYISYFLTLKELVDFSGPKNQKILVQKEISETIFVDSNSSWKTTTKKTDMISALDFKMGEIKPLYYKMYEFKKFLVSLWSPCFVSLKIYWPRGCWIPTILDWQTRYFFCKEQRSYAPKAPKLYYIFDTAWQE